MMMMPAIMADELGKHIASDFRRLFRPADQDKAERLDGAARMALECLGKSDALYHNVEHTFLVTLLGRDILHGRMLTERLEPDDYSHLIDACLLHDIGYVRGILTGDGKDQFVVDGRGATVTLRFVGVEGGFGRMLGLVDMWTLQAIRAAGNYAEIYEQNPGVEAQLSIPRDLIQLWTMGGVLYAPPIR